jgi:hypothetical protein
MDLPWGESLLGSVRSQDEILVHHDPNRKAWADSQGGLNIEIASGRFLADLIQTVLKALLGRDHHDAAAVWRHLIGLREACSDAEKG